MNKHEEFDIKNRKVFREKKLLQLVYGNYFNLVKQNLNNDSKNPILEIGSSGFIKDHIPNCITSNLVKNDPMIDRVANVFDLKIDNFFSNIIMIDIFHHLQFPKLALKNIHKILNKGGRVILIEPAMGLIPRIIYKLFHHEPNGFDFKINWNDEPTQLPDNLKYFAAQALSWRAFVKGELKYNDLFELKKVNYFSDFAYLGSGGFSFNSMYPEKFYPYLKKIDVILTKFSKKIFASRMLIVLEKKE
tara:strand:- start:169 stop:906 length:738 start_codon:yes stop_codon:yes gene_type:complete